MSVSTTIDIAKVTVSLAIKAISLQQESDLNLPRKIYVAQQVLSDLYTEDPTNVDLALLSNYTTAICAGYAFEAQNLLNTGGGGIIINPSTGIASLAAINKDFTVGQSGSLFNQGDVVFTINIGAGSIFQDGTFQVVLDGVVLPRNNNTRISYTVNYAVGIITVTMNQAAANGQNYIVTGQYFIS
jgi:hypothetical protein